MRKPPRPPIEPDEDVCDFSRPAAPRVRAALDGLAHFHVAHSDSRYADIFTKVVNATAAGLARGLPSERHVCIVLASDPEVCAALVKALEPFLPTLKLELPEPPKPPKPSIQ